MNVVLELAPMKRYRAQATAKAAMLRTVKGVDKTCQWGVEGQHKCPPQLFRRSVILLCRYWIR